MLIAALLVLTLGCAGRGSTPTAFQASAASNSLAAHRTASIAVPPARLSSGTPALPFSRRTPVALDPGAQAFLHMPFVGQFPFRTVSWYVDWLANKPSSKRVAVSTTPQADGSTLGAISLESNNGGVWTGGCAFGGPKADPRGLVWDRCPQLAALWNVGGPTSFASVQAARPFLPLFDVMLPASLPGGYQLTQVTLPGPSENVLDNLFVVSGIYGNATGTVLTVKEQPAGLNGPIFPDFSSCPAQRTQPLPHAAQPIRFGTAVAGSRPSVSCAAWADKAIYFFVASNMTSTPLDQVVQAIEGP